MPTRRKMLRLEAETFGDRLHRAYRTARDEYGLTYASVAEKLRQVVDVSDQTLMRYEKLAEMPTRPRQRQIVYFTLLAYGFDPADFGLTLENTALQGFDLAKVKRLLEPKSRCSFSNESGIPQGRKGISAGQKASRAVTVDRRRGVRVAA